MLIPFRYLATMTWVKPTVSGPIPEPHSFAAITALGNRIIITGGTTSGGVIRTTVNDVLVFNTDTYTWETPTILGESRARYHHTATAINDRCIVVIGGKTETTNPNDILTLELVN